MISLDVSHVSSMRIQKFAVQPAGYWAIQLRQWWTCTGCLPVLFGRLGHLLLLCLIWVDPWGSPKSWWRNPTPRRCPSLRNALEPCSWQLYQLRLKWQKAWRASWLRSGRNLYPDRGGFARFVVARKRWEEAQDYTLQKDPCNDLLRESCNFGVLHCLFYMFIEGSLEVKLPTIWTDEKQRWEESEKRREEKKKEYKKRESLRRKKIQVREKVGKSRNTVFFQWFVAPEGRKVGSLKWRERSHVVRWEMKNCMPLWREAHFQVKMYKAPQLRNTFRSWDVEKVYAVVARSTFRSQKC